MRLIFYPVRLSYSSAANTLSKNQDEQIIASSTDGLGFIRDCSDKNIEISNKRVLILGAGGASQSIIPAIARMNPAKLMVDNRSPNKISILLKNFPLLVLSVLNAMTSL